MLTNCIQAAATNHGLIASILSLFTELSSAPTSQHKLQQPQASHKSAQTASPQIQFSQDTLHSTNNRALASYSTLDKIDRITTATIPNQRYAYTQQMRREAQSSRE